MFKKFRFLIICLIIICGFSINGNLGVFAMPELAAESESTTTNENNSKYRIVLNTIGDLPDNLNCSSDKDYVACYFDVYCGDKKLKLYDDYYSIGIMKYCGGGISGGGVSYFLRTYTVYAFGDDFWVEEEISNINNETTAISAEYNDNGTRLTWKAEKGAFGYFIYRSKNGAKYTKVATINNGKTSGWTDKKRTGKTTTYKYFVKAYTYDANGKKIVAKAGNKVSCSAIGKVKLKANSSSNGIVLKWNKKKNSKGYKVYRIEIFSEKKVLITTIKKNSITSYVDKTAVDGDVYLYQVIPYYGKKIGDVNEDMCVAYVKPPTSFSVSSSSGAINVNLGYVFGQDIDSPGFEVQYSTSSDFSKNTTKTVKISSGANKKITGLDKGKTYYVRGRRTLGLFADKTGAGYGIKTCYSGWTAVKKITVN